MTIIINQITTANIHLIYINRFKQNYNSITIYSGGEIMDINYIKKYKLLGLNIAYYRKLNGYTQLEFAEILNIDRSHLSGMEIGKNAPSIDLIFKICDELNITEKELFDFR